MSENDERLVLPDSIAQTIISAEMFTDPDKIAETFTWVRANNPLGLAKPKGFTPFWVVSKHADVLEVSRRDDLFDSSTRPLILTEAEAILHAQAINGGNFLPFRSMTIMNDPDHDELRRNFAPLFRNPGMKTLEPRIREIARAHMDRLQLLGEHCDFVRDIGLDYPLRVIMEIIGVPPEDEPLMVEITNAFFGGDDAELNPEALQMNPIEQAEHLRVAFQPMKDYFAALTRDRRRNPKDDIATIIASATFKGEPMSDDLAFGHYIGFATGGHHTTASSLSGAIQILCERPDLIDTLRADTGLIPTFIEEVLRWITPAKHFMRCAVEDTELRGRKIRAGDWLYLSYASANRDEDVFEAPFEFRPDRKPIKHVAFGFGIHQCVGNMLARQEMRWFIEELVARVDRIEFEGEPVLSRSRWVQGLKSLPIRYSFRQDTLV